MNITVIGTGYVGLVTGACFAEMGNAVACVDVDVQKIENLKIGLLPIYEPGLEEIVKRNFADGRLQFTTSLESVISRSDVLFIAVGTPPGEDGAADLQYVLAVASLIGKHLDRYCVIVDKSTVPVGTADQVQLAIQLELDKRKSTIQFDVVSNPEFLKEGAAVADFMSPDRIVIGANSDRAKNIMSEIYAPFTRNHPRSIFMRVRDAEMTKYAANAMLATKISFMNEIAGLCEHFDVDVESVRLGIGSDQRIGFQFIYPGAGYGGSCFPKDVSALIRMAKDVGFDPAVLAAVHHRNEIQKNRLFEKISHRFGGNVGKKRIAVWGLSFKPGTDDMREAPSANLIKSLLAAGASVCAYDPVAMPAAKKIFESQENTERLTFANAQYEATIDADALVVVTEWKLFRHPDFKSLRKLMSSPIIFDGRNLYDPKILRDLQIEYHGIGREFVRP